jgi:hypothetical protein
MLSSVEQEILPTQLEVLDLKSHLFITKKTGSVFIREL